MISNLPSPKYIVTHWATIFDGDTRNDSFPTALFSFLEGAESDDRTYPVFQQETVLLRERLFKLKNENSALSHPADGLDYIFRKETVLDFEFARNLHLFDIITTGCFIPYSKYGDAMITLVYGEIVFFVKQKTYKSTTEIEIWLEAAHEDFIGYAIEKHLLRQR